MIKADSFLEFYNANSAFWEGQKSSAGEGTIFVDIMHDNQWYLRWNLLVAKYIQKLYGGRIVAVQHHWETPTMAYDAELNMAIAASYCVDEIVDLDQDVHLLRRNLTETEEAALESFTEQFTHLSELEGGELRQALLSLEGAGNPDFGWLTYDTFIRSRQVATIETWSSELERTLTQSFYWQLLVQRYAETYRMKFAVLGHVEYAPYAYFAQQAIDAGGQAFFMWPLVSGTLRIFRDRASLRQNRSVDFIESFQETILGAVALNHPKLEQFWDTFRVKFAANRAYKKDNLNDAASLSREEFLGAYGLNPNIRSVCLMSQALSDAVHANGPMVFDDFGQWILRTLEMCADRDDINLLVKVHPRDRVYSRDKFMADLIRKFDSATNLAILPRTVENADIVQNCDAVSTVHGTPGYELPLQGARAIIAGQSRYSGLGIAEQPTTEGEYLDSLLGKFDRNFDDASAKSAALMFAATEFNVFRCPSLFIRTDKVRVPPNAPFWREEAVSVSTLNVEDDPFFWALKDMCEMNRTHMLRLSFFEQ